MPRANNLNARHSGTIFFEIFGIARRQVAVFEQLAARASTGGIGWIDLLYPGQMGVEHKSAGEDLDAAMDQLLDYLPSLPKAEHPWLLVVSDFQRFQWKNLDNGDSGAFPLVELAEHLDLFMWLSGYNRPHESFESDEDANLQATELLATLHDRLKANGYEGHPLREWMTRILFCLFSDDTGVWERAAFHAYVALRTRPDGSDLGPTLAYLFQIPNTDPARRPGGLSDELAQFTYINGDLFAEQLPIPTCDEAIRTALLDACRFGWGVISPAIFGSMFQNVMEPEERRQLGAHYTTEQNILRTIRPLFLDDLAAEFEAADSRPQLRRFINRLAQLNFFDPACGCGNFLVVAYREVRRLETAALLKLRDRERRTEQLRLDIRLECKVTVAQFFGIEIEEFPARIARTALYLADHLANREVSQTFGQYFVRFPIPAAPHITIGNALALDWHSILPRTRASYVFGNPPFVGRQYRTTEQQQDMQTVFHGATGTGVLDYVACWFVKASEYMRGTQARAAFVATNSLSQGQNVAALWPRLLDQGLQIDFAHRTFAWRSEARGQAHVHVIIVGFSVGEGRPTRTIFDYPDIAGEPTPRTAAQISPYLIDAPPIIVATERAMLTPGIPPAQYGSMSNDDGGLLFDDETIEEARRDPVASTFIRPYIGGTEVLNHEGRWCLWLEDATPTQLRASALIRERLERVREYRLGSKRAATHAAATTPHLFLESRPVQEQFLLVPYVSSETRQYVPMGFYEPETIVRAPSWCIPGADLWVFGLLQSAMFMAWIRTVSGRLESRFQLSPGTSYNSFPFPTENSVAVHDRIAEAASAVLDVREHHPNETLATLYDPLSMPRDLVEAHRNLDRTVDAAFAPRRRFQSDMDRLALLFERYENLRGGLRLNQPAPATRRRRLSR